MRRVLQKSMIQEKEMKKKRKGEERTQQQWEKCSLVKIQQKSLLQVNTPPGQLICKEERHRECDKSLCAIFSLITNTSLSMIWKAFQGYMSFMESLAKKKKMQGRCVLCDLHATLKAFVPSS
ncbi:hypothetical protein GmHk_09G025717 [Glycine max]|nr:hypothetical protein GmHk_09G025717 [Glycine max]